MSNSLVAKVLRDRINTATAGIILFFVAFSAILWFVGEGTYFVKKATESHNILLVANNVRDVLSFVLQDVAASPDPAAHPFWYIHHPNLLAKIISLALSRLGFGLEGQTAIMLALNAVGLILVAAAFRTVSAAAALGALLTAVTSYGAFYFNAGDLCRGPLYLVVWLLLLALVRNPKLEAPGWNAITAAAIIAATLSDWGLAIFTVAFACCLATLGRGHVPWRWIICWVVVPAVGALAIYETAVVAAVGWDFFLIDLKVTYLGRMGAGTLVDYRDLLRSYRDNGVVIWPAHGRGTDTLFDLVTVLSITPLLNTGPAWLLLMPLALLALLRTLLRLRLGRIAWGIIGLVAIISIVGLVPLAILGVPLVMVGRALVRVPMVTPVQRLTGFVASALLAIISAAAIFPSFTMSFTIAPGHPPFPLIEMMTAALLAELMVSGVLARFLELLVRRRMKRGGARGIRMLFLTALIAVLALTALKITAENQTLFGLPIYLALGLALLLVGGPLIAAVNTQYFAIRIHKDGEKPARSELRALLGRSLWAVLLVAATAVLSFHKSANPIMFGQYSLQFAAFLAILLGCAVVALIMAVWPSIGRIVWSALIHVTHVFSPAKWYARMAAQVVGATAIVLVVGQALWLLISAATQPPQPIPYARALEQPQYREHSFLTTSEGAIIWYSTRGWTYMSSSNPPAPGPISARFRHFADWRNEAKYGLPEFFLCDNTRYGYVRAGTQVDSNTPADLTCKGPCTCHDVAADLAARGHVIEIDRDDFAIVRFHWPEKRQ